MTAHSTRNRIAALLLALALIGAACGGDDSGGDEATPSDEDASIDVGEDEEADGGDDGADEDDADESDEPASDLAALCPQGALDEAAEPVEIVYWHSMPRENEVILTQLADEFNASQTDVVVTLINQTSYSDTLTKYRAALSGGDLPDVVQLEDKATQIMVDSQSAVPAQACIEASGYDVSDHLPRVLDYYTIGGVLWPMPFNVSNPVLYYDRSDFTAAGLDPDDPPTTLEDIREASDAIVASGASPFGFALLQQPWFLQTWMAMAGDPYVDNGNGRDDRATEVLIDTDLALGIFEWINDMVDSGAAEDVGSEAGGNINHFLALGNGTSSMTIDTSAAIGTILAVLESGEFPGVEIGVAQLPGPSGDGGTFVSGGSNYIVASDDPARVEASWRWVSFLNEPESQATWSATGYIPIRMSATELPAVQDLWAETPEYRVAYDQLDSDVRNVATAGPVIGDFEGTDTALEDAMERMLTAGQAPAESLAQAKLDADEVLADYNSRIG